MEEWEGRDFHSLRGVTAKSVGEVVQGHGEIASSACKKARESKIWLKE